MIFSPIHKRLCNNFENAAKELRDYFRGKSPAPRDAKKKYYTALDELRFFLDAQGQRMPIPQVKYNPNDPLTWTFFG